ncbi:MAG TPA: hypothetical protein ENG21_03410 [Nitrososphaeria archaeon]|nr:hypothetical protein [Nitrososphaeria archaeon]
MDFPEDHELKKTKAEIVGEFVEDALNKDLKVKKTILDSGFFVIEVPALLDEVGIEFLIRALRNSKVSKLILAHHRKLDCHYEVGAAEIEFGEKRYTLLIVPREKKKRKKRKPRNTEKDIVENYVPMLTNKPFKGKKTFSMSTLSKRAEVRVIKRAIRDMVEREYRKRPRIENTYRLSETIRAHSSTRNEALKILLYGLSVILANFFMLYRALLYRFTGSSRRSRGISIRRFYLRVLSRMVELPIDNVFNAQILSFPRSFDRPPPPASRIIAYS